MRYQRTVLALSVWLMAQLSGAGQVRRPVTMDDLMKLASIVDVKISPQGDRVAYVVSRPSVEKNAHEPALYVVSTSGGEPRRIAESARILNTPLPSPKL